VPGLQRLGTKHFMGEEPCPVCHGARLRPEALNVFLEKEQKDPNEPIPEAAFVAKKGRLILFHSFSIKDAMTTLKELHLSKKDQEISKTVIKEITARLKFMLDVGLDYLTLDRRANTLSGGEAQRIRLPRSLGSGLVGALYVLDEPTIGLHQRDNERLIKTLINLRDLGQHHYCG
jgi:excinuclease ABC subunit A